ncbi:MAG: hypothetical protein IPM36_17110 [Lewinellaceae bacterium]|nr:hypothetical protein [Lewinellaceae bacterium]
MKERRSQYDISGADEPLIEEYKNLFDKISDFKGTKYLVIEKLKRFREALHENLSKPIKILKEKWNERSDGIENEISEYFRSTFKSDYLYIEFSKNMPERIAATTGRGFNDSINRNNLNFFQFLGAILDIQGLKNLVSAQLNFLDKVIECLNVGGF